MNKLLSRATFILVRIVLLPFWLVFVSIGFIFYGVGLLGKKVLFDMGIDL